MSEVTKLDAFPEGTRPESGPMQFGDDWPGTFMRGDHSLIMANTLEMALKHIPDTEWVIKGMLAGLCDTLRECSVGDMGWPPT